MTPPPSSDGPSEGRERLKISEVARRAGVPASTIKYYLAQGLLPKPEKTSRNMAYYDAITVEWVKLIKELQQESFLPLDVVRSMIGKASDPEQVRAYFRERQASDHSPLHVDLAPVPESTLLTDEHVTRDLLDALAALGVVHARGGDGPGGAERTYSGEDAAIVQQLARMREAGLTPERGFSADMVKMYQDALEDLAKKEIQTAVERVVGTVEPDALDDLARVWVDSANEMISLLHRKVLRRHLRGLAGGGKGGGGQGEGGKARRRRARGSAKA